VAIVVKDNGYSAFHRKLIDIAFSNLHKCNGGKSRHFSFICRKGRLINWGFNHEAKSHTLAHRFNYFNSRLHSELHAITRFPRFSERYEDSVMYNLRINRFNEIAMSKPCRTCQKVLVAFNLKDVYYTNEGGEFESLYK
jgi:hypothetical protein